MSFARAVVFLGHGCAAVLMVACTSPRDASYDDSSIVVALSAPPATLDPRIATDATGTRIAGLLYSSLVRLGPDLTATPEAAEAQTAPPGLNPQIVTNDLPPVAAASRQ